MQEIYTGKGVQSCPGAGPARLRKKVSRSEGGEHQTFYGKSHILNDASLDVRARARLSRCSAANGAGKSTLLKSLAGLKAPQSGSILFEGEEISGMPAYAIARLGIGYVPQHRGLFAGMTVAENLSLGRMARDTDGASGVVWSEEHILELFPRLKERLRSHAELSVGRRTADAGGGAGAIRQCPPATSRRTFRRACPAVVEELFETFDRLREICRLSSSTTISMWCWRLPTVVFALERGAIFHEGPAAALLDDLAYRKEILWL